MTVVITRDVDGQTTIPDMVTVPIEETDDAHTIVRKTLDGALAIVLIAPDPGSGEMTLLYPTEDAARAARALHRSKSTFTLTDSDHPARNKAYVVVTPGVRLQFDEQTRRRWLLIVPYQELSL